MIFAFIFAMCGFAALCNLLEGINAAFAPVFNSGEAVLAVAFATAVLTYRRLRPGKNG